MLEEEHAAGIVGMCFRPRVPFLNNGHLCGVIVSDHAVASLHWPRVEPQCLGSFSAGVGSKAALMRDIHRGCRGLSALLGAYPCSSSRCMARFRSNLAEMWTAAQPRSAEPRLATPRAMIQINPGQSTLPGFSTGCRLSLRLS
jgi:hypothetical protein